MEITKINAYLFKPPGEKHIWVIVRLVKLRVVKDDTEPLLRTMEFFELEKDKVSLIGLLVKITIKDITENINRGH